MFDSGASAALVFLIIYVFLFSWLVFHYVTGKIKWASRYSTLLFHVTIRLAAQGTGLAFGLIGYSATGLLVAFFILGAEGYFTLVLCTYRFLISWETHNLPEGSKLEAKHWKGMKFKDRLASNFSFGMYLKKKQAPPVMVPIHILLIVGNTLIVTGGSLLSGGSKTAADFGKDPSAKTGKALRIIGQVLFVAINVFLLWCFKNSAAGSKRVSGRIHPTLWLLFAAWPLLLVRGIYGVLQAAYKPFSYFEPSNYDVNGLTPKFTIHEYIMAMTMEWLSACILCATYYTSKGDRKLSEAKEIQMEKGERPEGNLNGQQHQKLQSQA